VGDSAWHRKALWSARVELETVRCYWNVGIAEFHCAESQGTIQRGFGALRRVEGLWMVTQLSGGI